MNERVKTEMITNDTMENETSIITEFTVPSVPVSKKEPYYLIGSSNTSLLLQFRHFYLGSLCYALFFTFCLYQNLNGITYPLFVGGSLYFFCSCLKKLGIAIKKDALFYIVSMMLLGISTFLTNSVPIILMNNIGILMLAFSFAIHSFYDDSKWSFSKHCSAVLFTFFGSIGCLDRPFRDIFWYKNHKNSVKSDKFKPVILGVLIAVPLLTIIIMLLGEADDVFFYQFTYFFEFWKRMPQDFFGIFFMFLFSFFAFYCIFTYLCKKKLNETEDDKRTLDPVIAITFTSLVMIVYLVFCFIQVRFLFLGQSSVADVSAIYEGFSFSEYAREGFFQLLFVCLINLSMVLTCLRRFRNHKILNLLLIVITGCTYIMIISSVTRMLLYIACFNLTFLRVMVLCALLIITILMTGVLITIFKPAFPLFRFGVAIVTVIYIVFSFSHPDCWIARYNLTPHIFHLEKMGIVTEADIDYDYLSQLSVDAVPVLLSEDGNLFMPKKYQNRYWEEVKYSMRGKDSLREFNVSRYVASGYLEAYRAKMLNEMLND